MSTSNLQPITLELQQKVTTHVQPTEHVLEVATMFGLGVDEAREIVILPPTSLTLTPGSVVFITGASGSGKSTLLRLLTEQIDGALTFDALPEPADRPLVDAFGDAPLQHVLRWLSLAGLGDAFVLLRKPGELSDGQRYRFRLAQLMAWVETQPQNAQLKVVLADEFGAALDRQTAQVVARNLAKWARRAHLCLAVATTHDDLLESLSPEVLVVTELDGTVTVETRG